jgi:hypothetical protein
MSNEETAVKPRSWARKLGRGLFYTIASLFVLGFIGKTIYKYSGSNQWELVAEREARRSRDGTMWLPSVKVYALKTPGSELEQTKAVVRMKTTMAGIVEFMSDPDLCKDMGCNNSKILERIDDQLLYSTFRYPYPGPFRDREWIVRAHFSQNPKTKEVLLEYSAIPDLLPPDDCCLRVARMNNTWRFRPVGKGEVEAQVVVNMDEGGFVPDFLVSQLRRRILARAVPYSAGVLERPKYQQAKFAFIQEP